MYDCELYAVPCRLLDQCSLALPAPGSAGPDSFFYTYDSRRQDPSRHVLVYQSGKLRASSLLTARDVAKDVKYAMQLKTGMEGSYFRYLLADIDASVAWG